MSLGSGSGAIGDYVYADSLDGGSVSFTFDVSVPGDYILEARIRSPEPNMGGHNSFYVTLDGEAPVAATSFHTVESDAFVWDLVNREGNGDYANLQYDPMVFTLSGPTHTFAFHERETQTQLDRIRLIQAEVNYHRADTDHSCDISTPELISFIQIWRARSGDLPMPEMMNAIERWNEGYSC